MNLPLTLAGLALAALAAPVVPGQADGAVGRIVAVEEDAGEVLCTLVVDGEAVRQVMEELAAQLSVDLVGFDGVHRSALVTSDLRGRPIRQVLEFVLGSVGLRAQLRRDTLTVLPDERDAASRADLLQIASAAYLRAQTHYPAHELAAAARIDQGRIEEERRNWSGAIEHYQIVAEQYATSKYVAEALFGAGRMHERLSQWSNANLVFRRLINLQMPHEFEAAGRVELVRCLIRVQDHATALHLLKILAEQHPPTDIDDARVRDMLAAEALIGSDEFVPALRKLERLESSGLALEDRLTVHSLRATAFEGLDMKSEAGRAWLIYARDATGAQRRSAIERAVRLAAEQGDELSILFALSQADDPVLEERLAPIVREARAKLGLSTTFVLDDLTVVERLDVAERELLTGAAEAARNAIEVLVEDRRALAPDVRQRFTMAWSGVLERIHGLDPALAYLAAERAETEDLEHRRQLDIHAAGLLEKHEEFDRAIDAYAGHYE